MHNETNGTMTRSLLALLVTALCLSTTDRTVAGELQNLVSDLYGGDGITLSQASGFGHDAHFTAGTLDGLDELGDLVASSLRFTAFNSTVTGFEFDLESGEPVRTKSSLGSILAESPLTIGKGGMSFGFSVASVEYDSLQGTNLDDLELTFHHPDVNSDGTLGPFTPFPGGPLLDFEMDEVEVALDLSIRQEVLAFYGTYGVSDSWDLTAIVPVVEMRGRVSAHASVFDPDTGTASPHFFDPSTGDAADSSNGGSEMGIGDVILRSKTNLIKGRQGKPNLAMIGQVELPTGDEQNLLGRGHERLSAIVAVAGDLGLFTPHANVGYEWVPDESHLSNLRYILGASTPVHSLITLAADISGRWELSGDGFADSIVDFSFGTKIEVGRGIFASVAALVPLNDSGLRSDLTWTAAVELAR